MRTHPYFDTARGRFEIFRTLKVFGNTPLMMFVKHLESGQKYFSSYSCNSEERYESIYILAPISEKEFVELANGRLECDMPFLNQKEGFKITVEKNRETDEIISCDPSDKNHHHIPGHYVLLVPEDLPF